MTGLLSTSPTRTCVGCRERRSARTMVRCVARDGGRVASGSDGRGAWVCSVECFDQALAASGFARAWRRTVDRASLGGLRQPVSEYLKMNVTTVKDCD